MRFGYNTNGFAHHRLDDTLEILAELGYQSVALTLDHNALNPYIAAVVGQRARIKVLLRRLGLRAVIETGSRFLLDTRRKHQPTLLSPTPEERQRRLDFLQRAIDLAVHLESDVVSFWSGTAVDDAGPEEWMRRLVAGCTQLCEYAERRKVRLAFEPEPGMFIDTMEQYARLVERIPHPRFGLTIDVGHLHCQGELPIGDHLRRWRERLWNIHIEDMKRGIHDHLMFGEGEIDFAPVLATLREIGYQGDVNVELSRHSHNAVETARKALTFLRGVS